MKSIREYEAPQSVAFEINLRGLLCQSYPSSTESIESSGNNYGNDDFA